ARRDRQRGARARVRRDGTRRGPPAGGAAVRALRARGLRARPSGGAVGRDAPARGVPAHAPRRPSAAAARRAVRGARLDHARLDAGLARGRSGGRAAHGPARDPRRGRGARTRGPCRGPVSAPGPCACRAAGGSAKAAAATRARHRSRLRRAEGACTGGARVVRRWALSSALFLGAVGLWQGIASLPGVDNLTLASPVETARALGDDSSLLLSNAWTTLEEVLLGLAVAVALGLGAAVRI